MHPIFNIYELVHQIASNLPRGSALALAKACQSTSNPALDIVWQHLASVEHLLNLVPSGLDNYQSDEATVSADPKRPRDLSRFQHYATKVQRICQSPESLLSNRLPTMLEEVARANFPQGRLLLPGLRELSWPWFTWRDFIPIRHLLCDTLTTLEIKRDFRSGGADIQSEEERSNLLSVIASICSLPKLSHLSIESTLYEIHPPTVQQYYESLFSPNSCIHTLEIAVKNDQMVLLPILGQMLNLSTLTVILPVPQMLPQLHQPLEHGVGLFKSLRSLTIRSGPLESAAEFLGLIGSTRVHTLHIVGSRLPAASDGTPLCAHLHKWESLKNFKLESQGGFSVLKMDDIRGLLENCTRLENFAVSRYVVDIEDKDMLVIAKSWPNIQTFSMNTRMLERAPYRVTLVGLQGLLVGCTRLSAVAMCLDLSIIPNADDLPIRESSDRVELRIGGYFFAWSTASEKYCSEIDARGYPVMFLPTY